MGKQKAPPPPDYAAAAKEQGAANLQAGQQTAALNRPTQIDSNGSQTWSLKEGADVKNPQAGDWIVTNKLNDTQQGLKDQQDALSKQFGDLASGSLKTVGDTMSQRFDTSGLPQASSLSTDGMQGFGNIPGLASHERAADVPQNRQGVAMGNEASRQRVTDALYGRQTAMLDPRTKQQSSDLTSRLASQGITEGSEAYKRATDQLAQQQNDAYAAARNDAITAGGAEDSRITGLDLSTAGFNNNNKDTTFGQTMQARGFNNDANDKSFDQGMSQSTLQNAIRAQQFGERQAMTSTNNTLHGNAVQEALMQRELGMNEANALRTGNQVGGTQFQAYGGGGQIAAAPVYQAAGDGFNANLAAVNANNASTASTMKGLTSMGAMFMGSDRRMKEDIVQVGVHPSLGIGLYDFTYKATGQRSHGVMSDEVRQVMPDAVMVFADGLDRVNYSMLGM